MNPEIRKVELRHYIVRFGKARDQNTNYALRIIAFIADKVSFQSCFYSDFKVTTPLEYLGFGILAESRVPFVSTNICNLSSIVCSINLVTQKNEITKYINLLLSILHSQ